MSFRFSLFVKSIAPLQCYLSKKVQVLSASMPFSIAEGSFSKQSVHVCSIPTDTFDSVQGHDELFNKSKDAIGHVLRAF